MNANLQSVSLTFNLGLKYVGRDATLAVAVKHRFKSHIKHESRSGFAPGSLCDLLRKSREKTLAISDCRQPRRISWRQRWFQQGQSFKEGGKFLINRFLKCVCVQVLVSSAHFRHRYSPSKSSQSRFEHCSISPKSDSVPTSISHCSIYFRLLFRPDSS